MKDEKKIPSVGAVIFPPKPEKAEVLSPNHPDAPRVVHKFGQFFIPDETRIVEFKSVKQ